MDFYYVPGDLARFVNDQRNLQWVELFSYNEQEEVWTAETEQGEIFYLENRQLI